MSAPDRRGDPACACGDRGGLWIYRIDGSDVLRRCESCGSVQVALTRLTPADLWALVGYLGPCDAIHYERAADGVDRWFALDEVAA